jgi:hypothetical protein
VKSSNALIEIEGGTKGVARLDDFVARFYRDSLSGIVYVSLSPSAPYVWTPIASGIIPPTPTDAGTAIVVSEGSKKVTCG